MIDTHKEISSRIKHQQRPSTFDRIDLELIENYIRLANGGNTHLALTLLGLFSQQVRRGERIDDNLLEFVTIAFEDILSGVKADKALRLTKLRKRPVENFSRDLHIAVKVVKKMSSGMTLSNAALDLSEEYGLHESQIQNIYAKHKKLAFEQISVGIVVP